jgi:hypothetical protein
MQTKASDLKFGDVIAGPDGISTIWNIEHKGHGINFCFAKGNGNRCWFVKPYELIDLIEQSKNEGPSAFAVNQDGVVLLSDICTVQQDGENFIFERGNARKIVLSRKMFSHIVGHFMLKV